MLSKTKLRITKKDIVIVAIFIVSLFIMDFSSLGQPGLRAFSGGRGMLDMNFFYSPTYSFVMMNRLGTAGINFYVRLLCIDFLFIVSFLYIQVKLLYWFVSLLSLRPGWNRLVAFAWVRAFFDIGENILLILMLRSFPQTISIANISGIITSLKWCTLILNVLLIIIILVSKFMLKGRKI